MERQLSEDVTTDTPGHSAPSGPELSDASGDSAGYTQPVAATEEDQDTWSSGEVPGLETDSLIAVTRSSPRPSMITVRVTSESNVPADDTLGNATTSTDTFGEVLNIVDGNSTVIADDDVTGLDTARVTVPVTETFSQGGVSRSTSTAPEVIGVTDDLGETSGTVVPINDVSDITLATTTLVPVDDSDGASAENTVSSIMDTTSSSEKITMSFTEQPSGNSSGNPFIELSTAVADSVPLNTTSLPNVPTQGDIATHFEVTTSQNIVTSSSTDEPSQSQNPTTSQHNVPSTSGDLSTSEDITSVPPGDDSVSSSHPVTSSSMDITSSFSRPTVFPTTNNGLTTPVPIQSNASSPVIPVDVTGAGGGDVTDATTYGMTSPAMSSGQSSFLIMGVGVAVGALLVILLLVMILVRRKRCCGKDRKRKYQRDEEDVQDYQYDLPVRLSSPAVEEDSKPRNGSAMPTFTQPQSQYDNPTYDEIIKSRPSQKNYFHEGIRMDDENEKEAVYDEPKMVVRRNNGSVPMTELKQKARMSMGPVFLQDDNASSQKIYDTIYTTHNTFKR